MRKFLCALLCAVLLLGVVPVHAVGITDVMVVANCSEWVSLREAPDTNSKRLKTVHLGELVLECVSAPNDFIYCNFDGAWGYILSHYLRPTDFTLGESFPGNQMVVNCKEWVSMRESPDASAKRVVKVPLGAVVTSCVTWYAGEFIYCEYKGYTGYISSAYLRSALYSVQKRNDKVVSEAAGKYPAITGRMQVVNCKEWVSLREKASSSSSRITKVELGEYVDQCVQVSDQFVYCHYNGLWGYIQIQYLQGYRYAPTVTAAPGAYTGATVAPGYYTGITAAPVYPVITPAPASVTPAADSFESVFGGLTLPSYNMLSQLGTNVVDFTADSGYTVLVQRAYGEREELLAVCYDPQMKPLWQKGVAAPEDAGSDYQTAAFIAGTAEAPLLVLYQCQEGFSAYRVEADGAAAWMTPNTVANATAPLIAASDADGNIFAAFDNKLLCLSSQGAVLWRKEYGDARIRLPFEIGVRNGNLEVYYNSDEDVPDQCWLATYNRGGMLLMLSHVEKP